MVEHTTFPCIKLNAHGLTLRRGYRTLVEGLGFTLAPGEMLQLMGANGAGKSTLLRALAGYIRPDAGDILWHGVEQDVPSHIHYLGHKDGLRGALTPVENLTFLAGLLGGDKAAVPTALEALGVARLADLPVDALSAGQRKRVALARLRLIPRPIWLLDEPLTALDADGQGVLLRLLANHLAQSGMVIAASHQPLIEEGLAPRTLNLSQTGAWAA